MSLLPSKIQAVNSFPIRRWEDFPNKPDVNGQILLETGVYNINEAFTTPFGFLYNLNAKVTWNFNTGSGQFVIYVGTGVLFSGVSDDLEFFGGGFALAAPGATCFDISTIEPSPGIMTVNNCSFFAVAAGINAGEIKGFTFIMEQAAIAQFSGTLLFSDTFVSMYTCQLFGIETFFGPIVKFEGTADFDFTNVVITGVVSIFDIDPTFTGTGSFDRVINVNRGQGTQFFVPSTLSGTFTSVLDNSYTVKAVTAVVDDGGDALFQYDPDDPPFLVVGLTINFASFTQYANGDFFIIEAIGGSFKVATTAGGTSVAFNGNDTGGVFTTTSIRVVSSIFNSFSDGESVLLSSELYDQGFVKLGEDNITGSMILDTPFLGDDSGELRNGSLTQQSKFVNLESCPGITDDQNIGSACVVNNTTTTALVQNVFTDLDFTSSPAEKGINIELWRLTDTITGELLYQGLENFSGVYVAVVYADPPGGNTYQFRLIKNGSPLVPAQIFPVEGSIAVQLNLGIVVPITAVPGDKFRIQVQNIDAGNGIDISNVSINIQ